MIDPLILGMLPGTKRMMILMIMMNFVDPLILSQEDFDEIGHDDDDEIYENDDNDNIH